MNQWSGFILSECFEINLSERKEIIPESPGMCFFRPRQILLRNKQIWEETIIILTKCHPNTDTLSIKPGSSYLLYNPYFLFSPRKRSKSLKFIGFVYKKEKKLLQFRFLCVSLLRKDDRLVSRFQLQGFYFRRKDAFVNSLFL